MTAQVVHSFQSHRFQTMNSTALMDAFFYITLTTCHMTDYLNESEFEQTNFNGVSLFNFADSLSQRSTVP